MEGGLGFNSFCLSFLEIRDADETKEWIEEKNQALNTDNYGHDLASVQALQRKHEGFERDLAALGDKVRFWGREPKSFLFIYPKWLNYSSSSLCLHCVYFPFSNPRWILLVKLPSVWSSHIRNLLKISKKNALSWIRLGIVWENVLTSAKRSLEILMTCSVSSVTSGSGAIPPLNLFIISEVYMAYCSTGIFLWRVQKWTVVPVLTYFSGGREKFPITVCPQGPHVLDQWNPGPGLLRWTRKGCDWSWSFIGKAPGMWKISES